MAYSVFQAGRRICAGDLAEAAEAVALSASKNGDALIFEDETGRVVDLDLREGWPSLLARLTSESPSRNARGRPKLGVCSKEVTLLPRHWDWLAAQSGGASATLRRLTEQAMRSPAEQDRAGREAAYRFLSALAGDFGGYEEAVRALFAGDLAAYRREAAHWPEDVREYAARIGRLRDPDEVKSP